MIEQVVKSDGRIEKFEPTKYDIAMIAAANAVGMKVSSQVLLDVSDSLIWLRPDDPIRHVDEIHDAVERSLIQHGEVEIAREYMSYRMAKRNELGRAIPPSVREAFDVSAQYFPTPAQAFQFYNKYARFDHELGRRETWPEAVNRVVSFLSELAPRFPADQISRIHDSILNLRAMPSMRLLAMAGPAARRNNTCLYNCAYEVIDDPYAFVEALLILGHGTGFGYSVESRFVNELPIVGDDAFMTGPECYKQIRKWERGESLEPTIVIDDSLEGWATALFEGLKHWWAGLDIKFDYSEIREAGAPLKTKGGTASGPEPLRRMLNFVRETLLGAVGRKLTTLEVHDLLCVIADCIVSGGVRRSAMIALFDWNDQSMLNCKSGNWFATAPWRSNANNSAVMPNRDLRSSEVCEYVERMHDGRAGEPGLFSRRNSIESMPARRRERLSSGALSRIGTNPCGEIVLLDGQFCNLSNSVARPGMTDAELLDAVQVASMIGTIQSSATKFPGLRDKWRANCEAERLLGTAITGHMDYGPDGLPANLLGQAAHVAVTTNQRMCGFANVNTSAAVTCTKPDGNGAWLLGCSSGIGARHSKFQIRRFTLSENEPMFEVLKRAGVPMERYRDKWLAVFPIAAPLGTQTAGERSALTQLNYWARVKLHYTEHNPSCTINYRESEIEDIQTWLFENQDIIGGLSFLPYDDHAYTAAPNEEISEDEYNKRVSEFPTIDFSQLYAVERTDQTTGAREFACAGNACDIG